MEADMRNDSHRPILYIDENTTPESQEAIGMLEGAGFDIDVKIAPSQYRAAYGTPVLFGLFNKFEGLEGIQIFLKNSTRPH
jgi:hypothetical protein